MLPAVAFADATAPDQAAQGLGPAAQGPTTSSSADGSTLQPAGNSDTSTLQQQSPAESQVLGDSTAQDLQSPNLSTSQLSVISDGADGDPQSVGGGGVPIADLVALSLLIGAVVASGAWFVTSKPRFLVSLFGRQVKSKRRRRKHAN